MPDTGMPMDNGGRCAVSSRVNIGRVSTEKNWASSGTIIRSLLFCLSVGEQGRQHITVQPLTPSVDREGALRSSTQKFEALVQPRCAACAAIRLKPAAL